MDGAREQFLAAARLAADEDTNIGLRHALRHLEQIEQPLLDFNGVPRRDAIELTHFAAVVVDGQLRFEVVEPIERRAGQLEAAEDAATYA